MMATWRGVLVLSELMVKVIKFVIFGLVLRLE
jgi:hypothetical protein